MSEELYLGEFTEEQIRAGMLTSYTVQPAFFTPQITIVCSKTKKAFKYTPQDDITNIELANLLELFAYMAASSGIIAMVDVDAFVTVKKLERHFQIT